MFGNSFYIFFLRGYMDLFSSHSLIFLTFSDRFKKGHVIANIIILEPGVPLFVLTHSECQSKKKHDMTNSFVAGQDRVKRSRRVNVAHVVDHTKRAENASLRLPSMLDSPFLQSIDEINNFVSARDYAYVS